MIGIQNDIWSVIYNRSFCADNINTIESVGTFVITKLSIKEIKERLLHIYDENDAFLLQCSQDERKGVQQAVASWKKSLEKQLQLENKWLEMNKYENEVLQLGFKHIVGIDEVGRGPLAGPVVAAAVILPRDLKLLGLDDSKKMTDSKKEQMYEEIMASAIAVGVGIVSNEIIDKINIYEATKVAMMEAVKQLSVAPDYALIDAMKLPLVIQQQSIIKGDANSVSIAAASVVAKVTRDRLMKEYDEQYPQYCFKKNMGYGTKEHLDALAEHGLTPWHRRSFAPVKELIK